MEDTNAGARRDPSAAPLVLDVPPHAVPERLDKVLARWLPQHSRSRLQAWIEAGQVHVNGVPARIRTRVRAADHIALWPQPAPEADAFVAEPVPFEVWAQAADWIAVNKPAGLVTHPGAGNWHGTLLNGLLHRFPELAELPRAGIVHRLDKDTSGLLIVARSAAMQDHLAAQLRAHTMGRTYCALVRGELREARRIDAALGRDAHVPVRRTARAPIAPKTAVTHVRPRALGHWEGQAVSEVWCTLETGRTHQIRAHLASIGHPLLGDRLYGGPPWAGAARQMLHAQVLRFHDLQGQAHRLEVLPPADFLAVRAAVGAAAAAEAEGAP